MSAKYKLLFFLLLFTTGIFAQDSYIISGKITDSLNKENLEGATVAIKGTKTGTFTRHDGSFELKTSAKLPIILTVSSIGYKKQEFIVDNNTKGLSINLHSDNLLIEQVVVSASRVRESILRSPVSIEKLDIKAIRQTAAPTFFDALENIKGVQMTTLSMGYKVPNTRGFSGTTNSRFLQMVDGVDNISPGIGAPVANAVGPSELDIESVELIPGAASAIYGLNAISGIANLKTKSPFKYEGLSIYQKTGVNHIDGKHHDASLYTETAIRFAKVFREKLAFKVNAAYSSGYDWVANNLRDLNPNANASAGLTGNNNPARDPINSYGNESSNRKTVTLNGKNYIIARTGYQEKEITDYSLKNFKVDAALHYKVGKTKELSYSYRFGEASNQYQRGNRIRLDGLQIQQHALDFKGEQFFLRAYYTRENTGDSYNLRPTGENMDRAFKSDNVWLADYRTAYLAAINGGSNNELSHAAARASADNGRYQPGTAAFNNKLKELTAINNWDTGSALIMNTGFVHAEGQYDWSAFIKGIQILTGFNYRNFIIHPDGNSYVNPESYTDPKKKDDILNYYSYGAFIQATKKLLEEKLKIVGSLRIDKTQYFSHKLNPRLAVVYTLAEKHNFRISYQNGFRFPTLFEGFSFVDNGGIKRLGGLKVMSEYFNVFENSYIRASQDAFISAVNKDVNTNGLSQNDAIVKNKGLLVKSNYTYLRPEQINSLEIGYKTSLFKNKLFIDADFYFNRYKDFIGQVELTRPNTGVIGQDDSTAFYAFNPTQNKRYRLWTNSTSLVSNQGASLGVTWNFYKQFQVSGNVSYSSLVTVSNSDALIPAFNTPKWITNFSIGNRELTKNTGFNITWRWQDSFFWQSPLADGNIPAYSVVDAQVNYRVSKAWTILKLGASNLFNKRYYQYEGGPVIGGFYYLTLVFDTYKK